MKKISIYLKIAFIFTPKATGLLFMSGAIHVRHLMKSELTGLSLNTGKQAELPEIITNSLVLPDIPVQTDIG